MKALVATALGQGARPSDVMGCIEGELVFLMDACPEGRRLPYGPCPCGITFRGSFSLGATSTAIVQEIEELTLEDYTGCLEATYLDLTGEGCACGFDADGLARRLIDIAAPLHEGSVVERCVDQVRVRLRAV